MNGADAIVKCLELEGITEVFGYPGVAICPFYNSILDSDISTVLIRTEQNAAHAASGLARVTGKVGVCAVVLPKRMSGQADMPLSAILGRIQKAGCVPSDL